MKALRFHEFGDLGRLKIETLPDPVAGPGEIKVRVHAAAINPSDTKNIQGKMEGTTLPRTPGRDFAGVVEEGPLSLRGMEIWGTGGDIGYTRDGSHAEFILIPAEAAAPKPSNLSFEEAAAAGLNFVTAYEGLINRAKVQPGEIVLATGALGGVGSAALQLARAYGAKVIGVDRAPTNDAKLNNVEALGYFSTSQKNWTDSARQLTGGKGADIAFDCVGGELFESALSTLGHRGRQINITSAGTRRVSFDLLDFYHRNLTLLGIDSRPLTVVDSARILNSLAPLFAKGTLKPAEIARRGSLEDASDLYSFVDKGGHGKAVFVMS